MGTEASLKRAGFYPIRRRGFTRAPHHRTRRGPSRTAATAHRLYICILRSCTPHKVKHVTVAKLAGLLNVSPITIRRAIRILRATKPWLQILPAGRAGLAIFWRPEAGYKKNAIIFPHTPIYKKNHAMNDPGGSQSQVENGELSTKRKRRQIMRYWRRRSYKDPSFRWAKANGADLVRIIGHFVWHAKVSLERLCLAIRRFICEFTSASLPLPAGGKPLFQCLFVRLNAKIAALIN